MNILNKTLLWIVLAVCLVVGPGLGWFIGQQPACPNEVKIVFDPKLEVKVRALESRVELLEAWAVKFGGRMK